MTSCHFCQAPSPSYVCPRCAVPYCSLSCYKCQGHAGCSEDFYRECVEAEMKEQKGDDTDKQKIQEALLRERQAAFVDDDLGRRLAAVDLDNSEEVLKAMTNEEVCTFNRLVESNEIAKYISVWKPWWTVAKRLVEEVTTNQQTRAMDTDSLAGFRRQRKETRSKLGGRKVKDLRVKTEKAKGFPKTDEVVKVKQRSENTPTRNSGALGGTRSEQRVDPVGEYSIESSCKMPARQKIHVESVETARVKNDRYRSDKKTRIVDTRYRGSHSKAIDTNAIGNDASGDQSFNPQRPEKLVEPKIDDNRPHKGRQLADSQTNAVNPCQQPVTKSHTEEQDGDDLARRTGAGRSPEIASVADSGKNLLLDQWVGDSGDSEQPSGWGSREKVLASNIVNMLTAYVFIARFFNGDLAGDEIEVAEALQSICSVFKGQNFQTVDVALGDVLLQDVVVRNVRGDLLANDVSLVLATPEYVQRALFETRTLLKTARRCLDKQTYAKMAESCSPEKDCPDEVHTGQPDDRARLKNLKLLMLKTDFYFDWATHNMTKLQRWTSPIIALEKEKLMSTSTNQR